ncbi:uncharacterized protein LOC133883284 [Phragmites australis]|uniref:uncharacterized protein LOC133883284 n=1 Tax=Phragmites australis TaxID=29695 RepID=UPI002D7821C4|nr:uncharacterized protein LOC133883284 [Phragmites australis]
MRIFEQLGSRGDDMHLDKGEENAEDTPDTQRLKLEISDSFLSSISLMLAWDRNGSSVQSKYNDRNKYEELKTAQNQLISVKKGKRMPTVLPLRTLTIGHQKFISMGECNIFAKFCYLTKNVVCQMCYEKLSRKVDILFSDITSILVCFDRREFDTLRIEAKSSFKSFSADKPRPGKFPDWEVDNSEEDGCFPESKFVFLEIEKGVLEKGFAKLMYSYPRLERIVKFARGDSGDQHMYQGCVHASAQQTNTFALHPLPSENVFPYIGW